MVFTRKVIKPALQMRSRGKTRNLIALWWTRLVRAQAPTVTCPESTRLPSRAVEVSELLRSLFSHLVSTTISLNTGLQSGRRLTPGEHAALGTPEYHLLTFKTFRILIDKVSGIWPHSLPRQAPVKDRKGKASPADLLNNHPILKKYSLMVEE